jgi:hypothetical protein
MSIGIGRAKKTQFNWVITGGAALVNIGLNLVLIPPYGMIGAAISTLIAYLVMFFGMTIRAQQVFRGKRLGEVRIRAQGQGALAVGLAALGGDHQDGRGLVLATPDKRHELEAREVRHVDVQKKQVRFVFFHLAYCFEGTHKDGFQFQERNLANIGFQYFLRQRFIINDEAGELFFHEAAFEGH